MCTAPGITTQCSTMLKRACIAQLGASSLLLLHGPLPQVHSLLCPGGQHACVLGHMVCSCAHVLGGQHCLRFLVNISTGRLLQPQKCATAAVTVTQALQVTQLLGWLSSAQSSRKLSVFSTDPFEAVPRATYWPSCCISCSQHNVFVSVAAAALPCPALSLAVWLCRS